MQTQLILASQSPYRKAQLTALGYQFQAHSPKVNEEELKAHGPQELFELTRYLAFHKAQSLVADFPDAVILGSDQIAECEGQRLDKPGTLERAEEQLMQLQGRTHRLLTSLVVIATGSGLVQTFTNISTLEMYPLTREEVRAYLAVDRPLDCAGSYKLECAGSALIKSLTTDDASAVQGLPLLSLGVALRKLNLPVHAFWPR